MFPVTNSAGTQNADWFKKSSPVLWGVKPIYKDANGKLHFKSTSGIAIYSIFLFIVMSIITGFVLRIFMQMIFDFDLNFDDAIMVYASIAYTGFIVLSLLAFFEGDKTAEYYTSWKDFEVRYFIATRKPLRCHLKKNQYVFLILSSFLSVLFLYFIQITLTDLSTRYDLKMSTLDVSLICICSIYDLWVIFAFEANWFFLTLAIQQAASILLSNLKDHKLRTHSFDELYKLWLDLNSLTQNLGSAFSWTYSYYLTYMFLMVIGCSYSFIASLWSGQASMKFTYLTIAISSYLVFGVIADCAHRTTFAVGHDFKHALLKISLNERDPVMKRDLKWFYQMISFNPPIISLSGYMKLNRNYNVSMLGTLVTYMVVVLQFRSSSNLEVIKETETRVTSLMLD